MVDLKNEPAPTPKKAKLTVLSSMTAVKNWFTTASDKKGHHQDGGPPPPFRQRMPDSFLRSIRRRSLRVKRAKSLVMPEKRKSDSFVNSQEWTLSRSVPDIRLGIIGSLNSGKSALVHRYLTGSYMQEESPEGGRFKKEILVDNQSFLLLIRDEGGAPELQFTAWVDAVIFVFSLENEQSFNAIYNYYTKMSQFRNSAEIPLILVGTQDAISENNPRVIDDSRARKLANDLKRCTYYETCATYGLNVERVFQDACHKIVQQRLITTSIPVTGLTPTNSRPSTPNNHYQASNNQLAAASRYHISNNGFSSNLGQSPVANHMSPSHTHTLSHKESIGLSQMGGRQVHTLSSSSHHLHRQSSDTKHQESLFRSSADEKWNSSSSTLGSHGSSQALVVLQAIPTENNNIAKFTAPHPLIDNNSPQQMIVKESSKDLPTPTSTPTTSRKSRRRSNLFTPSKKADDKLKNGGDIGVGRAIPLKQGYLYKRSSKPLNKEWKKKYVTLCDDGILTYHPSLHDYMNDVHGKEIPLQYVTVKVPGQKPRGSKSIITVVGTNGSNGIHETLGGLTIGSSRNKSANEKVLLTAYDVVKEPGKYTQMSGDESNTLFNSNCFVNGGDTFKGDTPNVKKRHRRMKSSGIKSAEYDDGDAYEFYIVSLDNKQWNFEASSSEERDEWVSAIEQQILNSLQLNESTKTKKQNSAEAASIQSIRARVAGNEFCVDCDAQNPDWASLNLGVLMCIECSGIHRNLGSHISKVRSLNLDEWPPSHLSIMLAIGNKLANSVFEHRTSSNRPKPGPSSSREEKERWIRSKYESKEFLPPASNNSMMSLDKQLIEAVCASNMKNILIVLAQATAEDVNSTVGTADLRSPLHLACAMGNLAVAQLLIWHNADVKATDEDGRTCLTYARAALSIATAKFQQSRNNPAYESQMIKCNDLIDLLIMCECPEANILPGNGTLPRRRGTQIVSPLEKVTSSVI